MKPRTMSLIAAWALLVLGTVSQAAGYDPLAIADAGPISSVLLDVTDADRNQRVIPLKVYLPPGNGPAPVILYSHGLGGSRETAGFLGRQWAARGFVAVFMQHPGSDESVWADLPPRQRFGALRKAANFENFLARVRDVPVVIDQLSLWNSDAKSPLAGRMDLTRIGMSGHSFGALTTQAVSGQASKGGGALFTDKRIQAALIMSPSVPRDGTGTTAAEAFGAVHIPWLLMTGTRDVAPIGNATMASRLGVYPALPPGNKYELVLEGAEHSVFTDRALPGDHQPRNPNHHRAILALSTAFWDANLRNDAQAREWLNGAGPASVLEPKDRWQHQ